MHFAKEVSMRWLAVTAFVAAGGTSLADDWPQWLGPRRDAVWRETGILQRFSPEGLKFRWRVPIGGGYAGPAVANGRVFVMDRRLAPAAANPANPFSRDSVAGAERVLCLDGADGHVVWQHEYECEYAISYAAGPRATPTVAHGKVYALGAEGDLCCLEETTGRAVWARNLKKDYDAPAPLWGFASHPLVDGNKLISLVGGEGSAVVAFDKDSGKELWGALSAKDIGYAPPMIYEFGGRRQLIVWHPEAVNALDPETGAVLWSEPFKVRSGLSIATPRKLDDLLLVTAFYDGARMFRVSDGSSSLLWRSRKASERDTDTLHGLMSTPFLEDGHLYGVCSYGQLRGLKAATGERLWETLSATTDDGKATRWANTFLVKHEDRFFLPNEKGDLIIAKLSPEGYEEISRTHLLDPANKDPGRMVVWSHPAFASRCVYARNDREIVCASLAAQE